MSKNLLTIEAFAEWCEEQPADKRYDVFIPMECAVGQYARHLGFHRGSTPGFGIYADASRTKILVIPGLTDDAMMRAPFTFGALAKRLRSLSA